LSSGVSFSCRYTDGDGGERICSEFGFEFFDAGQIGLKWLGQGLEELVFGNAHWLGGVPQGVFGHDAVLGLAK
jgi:hypothetical protein